MQNHCHIKKNKEKKILVKKIKKINQFKVITIDNVNYKYNNKNFVQLLQYNN
jgi:hypothetical protein